MSYPLNSPDKELKNLSLNDNNNSNNNNQVPYLKSPRSSSTYSNINADIQAKLHKFHEQRSKGNINNNNLEDLSLNNNHNNHNHNNDSLEQNDLISSQSLLSRKDSIKRDKPLPPLPPSSSSSSSTNSQSNLSNKSTIIKPDTKLPIKQINASRPAPSLPINSQVSPQVVARLPKVKPSLSMRRGMKLPGGLPQLDKQIQVNEGDQGIPINSNNNSVTQLIDKKGKLSIQQSNQLKGLFANYSNYIDIKSGSLNFAGKLSLDSKGVDFSSGSSFRISSDELEFIEEIGRGNYGTVSKVLHKPTGVLMAMKEVRLELDESKFRQILMELEVLHKCNSPFIVDFYGAFFVEGAVYMCIEYMDGGSLDKIYGSGIDEDHLAYITNSVIRGLMELKDNHNIIHRDVKPTNILISTNGKVKLCDFGVSGNLVASLAKTNIGCQSYMAPERIKSLTPDDSSYSVQSDIWSLGLTILETAKGCYPYPPETYDNIFSQLSAIVDGDPPSLPDNFSNNAKDFVNQTLNKIPNKRPNYQTLLLHPWLQSYKGFDFKMDQFVVKKLQNLQNGKPLKDAKTYQELNSKLIVKKTPALHRGGANNLR
ncbi:hypothetical protein WICMUC_002667 [Wickerhamomyces mucosus]|uniref:mitogen-activated protein kinase kinase n=1 Tax=Wickerhamomyces mucosus TaxID=1378264 RepID=A0A9P8PNW2_9ASCO|nr:hypothetical protein WICMUC_002667 [Wickerhamomyces mucosus]